MSEEEERTSIIGVLKDGVKYKLDNLPPSTILDWFFNKRDVVEYESPGAYYIGWGKKPAKNTKHNKGKPDKCKDAHNWSIEKQACKPK